MAIAGGLLGKKNLRGYSWRFTGRERTYVAISGGLLGEKELTWI